MSRIRSVHPRLFTDEAFATASPLARLLIIGIWTECWDDGVFEWKALTLKMRIFPADNIDVSPLLDELESLNIVSQFEASGKRYGAVRNFGKFQNPKKPNKSGALPERLYEYTAYSEKSSEPVRNQFGTSSEIAPLKGGREEGRKEDNSPSDISNEISSGSSTALPFDPHPQPEILDLRKARERKSESDLDLLDKVTDLWNAWARRHGSPQVQRLNETRAKHCRRRIADLKAFGHESPETAFQALLEKCSLSFYARGSPRKPLDFDQLMREDFMTKMLEGVYEYREAKRL